VYLKFLKPALALGTRKIAIINANKETMVAPIMYGLKNLVNEIPELSIAITSVLFASFEVNQIMDKNKKLGTKD
jgi:hypothetical protein